MLEAAHHSDLKEIQLFSNLSTNEAENLRQGIGRRNCARSEVIYNADKPGEDCFFILKGRVRLYLGLEDGREVSFEMLGPGDFFGEGVLLEPTACNCAAQAIERTELLVVPRRQLLQLMEGNGRFSLTIARYLAGRLAAFRQQHEMMLHSVNIRFARLLLALAHRYGTTATSGATVRLNVKLTHQEMANFIGTARETLTLTIGKFRSEGVLAESGRTLVIKNMAELERRASPIAKNSFEF